MMMMMMMGLTVDGAGLTDCSLHGNDDDDVRTHSFSMDGWMDGTG